MNGGLKTLLEQKKVKLDGDQDDEYKNQITEFIDDRVFYGKNQAVNFIPQYRSRIMIRESANDKKLDDFFNVLKEIANADDVMAAKLRIHRKLDNTSPLPPFDKMYSVDTVRDDIRIKKEAKLRGGRKLLRRRKSKPKSKSKHYNKQRSYKKSSYRRRRH